MLTILLTPTTLAFNDLTDEMKTALELDFDLKFVYVKGKPHIEGTPEELYKTLYLLSTKYDIEVV